MRHTVIRDSPARGRLGVACRERGRLGPRVSDRSSLGDATDRRCFEPAGRPLSATVCARSPACSPARKAASTSRVSRADRPTVFASDRTTPQRWQSRRRAVGKTVPARAVSMEERWRDPGDPRHRFDASRRQSRVIAWATTERPELANAFFCLRSPTRQRVRPVPGLDVCAPGRRASLAYASGSALTR